MKSSNKKMPVCSLGVIALLLILLVPVALMAKPIPVGAGDWTESHWPYWGENRASHNHNGGWRHSHPTGGIEARPQSSDSGDVQTGDPSTNVEASQPTTPASDAVTQPIGNDNPSDAVVPVPQPGTDVTTPQEPTPPAAGNASNHLDGLCFSLYLKGSLDQDISSTTIDFLLDKVTPYTGSVRGFGSQDFWPTFYDKARVKGLVVAGAADIWTDRAGSEAEVSALTELCKSKRVDMAVVGDETMDDMDGPAAVGEATMLDYINKVKAEGGGVPVGSSQTYYVWKEHPDLVTACDFVVMNIYPYWEGLSCSDSLDLIDQQYHDVLGLAQGKPVYIETGWPSAGSTIDNAVPSPDNSGIYMAKFMEWAKATGARYWYFNAFDEDWKSEEGDVGPHWGIWDNNANLKPDNAAYLEVK